MTQEKRVLTSTSGRLHDLNERECWDLLAGRTVGRLVWQGTEGPTAIPVNFAVSSGSVLVRTAPYSSVARECDDSRVAFQVDDVDEATRSGWSVLIRGRAHIDYHRTGRVDDVDVWPAGPRPLYLSIEADSVSGRRLTSS